MRSDFYQQRHSHLLITWKTEKTDNVRENYNWVYPCSYPVLPSWSTCYYVNTAFYCRDALLGDRSQLKPEGYKAVTNSGSRKCNSNTCRDTCSSPEQFTVVCTSAYLLTHNWDSWPRDMSYSLENKMFSYHLSLLPASSSFIIRLSHQVSWIPPIHTLPSVVHHHHAPFFM